MESRLAEIDRQVRVSLKNSIRERTAELDDRALPRHESVPARVQMGDCHTAG